MHKGVVYVYTHTCIRVNTRKQTHVHMFMYLDILMQVYEAWVVHRLRCDRAHPEQQSLPKSHVRPQAPSDLRLPLLWLLPHSFPVLEHVL